MLDTENDKAAEHQIKAVLNNFIMKSLKPLFDPHVLFFFIAPSLVLQPDSNLRRQNKIWCLFKHLQKPNKNYF